MAGFGEDGIVKAAAVADAELELSLESPEDEAKRLKKLEAPVEAPASAEAVEMPQAIAEAAEEQAQKDAAAYDAALAQLNSDKVAGDSAEKISTTWDELGVDRGKLEKILLTDELTASDSPEAAEISDEARAENRIVRTKAEEQLFQKLGNGTLLAEEKALLLQHVAKKTAWTHPSGFIPEAARKDEEVMRAVAQGSPAGARFAKDLGFNFSSQDESAVEKELDPVAQKIMQAKTLGELVTILNESKSYESPEAGHIEVNLDVQTMVYEITQKNAEVQRLLAAADAKENPKIQQRLGELNQEVTNRVSILEPHLQNKVRGLLG